MLASKSEKDALGGTLFFNVAHYALRSWPWIIVALASILVYPQLSDIQRTFPYVDPKLIGHDMAYPAMMRFLPPGMLGLMVAGLIAAYVSTISTHLNWGTSYLVHDFYRRFLKPGKEERHYVFVGRLTTAFLMLVAAAITLARSGCRVLVLEAKDSAGGGTRTAELTLPGFWHDVCSAIHPIGLASPFLRSLPLAEYGLQWVQPPVPFAHPLDNGEAVALYRSVEETAHALLHVESAARGLGTTLASPFSTLSFLALPVIPELRLTDRGLVDVHQFRFVDLFV